jgi:hypothetical protein
MVIEKIVIIVTVLSAAVAAQTAPCVRKVFVTGHQVHAIAWANKHLAKETCMIPVDRIEDAEAILELEPDPKIIGPVIPQVKHSSDDFWVNCSSDSKGSYCSDSEGNLLETNCSYGRNREIVCSSYYGPNPARAVGQVGYALMYKLFLQNVALAYVYDRNHHLLWSFTGRKPWETALAQGMKCLRGSHMTGYPYNKMGNKGKSDTCPPS